MSTPQEEIKKLAIELREGHEAFVKQNNDRLDRLEKNGSVPADIKERVEKTSTTLCDIEEKIEGIKTAMSRISTEGASPEVEEKKKIVMASKAMQSFMRKGKVSPEQHAAYLGQMKEFLGEGNEEFKTLSVSNEADGGYLVLPQQSAEIQKKVFESSPMRELAEVISISSDALEEVYDNDEPDSEWVGEMATRSVTDNNQLSRVRIDVHELHASPKATQKLLDDSSFNVEAWHAQKVAEKFARAEATAFIAGNGVAKPRGILNYTSGDGFNKIEQVDSGSNGAATANKLIELQGKLLENFQPNATWLMRRSMWIAVRQLVAGDGHYLVMPGSDLMAQNSMTLLGRPVRFAADMEAATTNSLSIAYGDFKAGYRIVDRVGIRVLRDPYTVKGFVVFYTTKRVGGGVKQFQAIKLMKLGS